MTWGNLLVAADDSPAGLHAVRVAEALAGAANVRLSVLTVLTSTAAPLPSRLVRYQPLVAYGVPGIEIVRVADELRAGLLVLGRTWQGASRDPRLGPTADAVARRSRIPCLYIPLPQKQFSHLVVAIDGTERGLAVLEGARDFLAVAGRDLEVVTVEPRTAGYEDDGPYTETPRSLRVAEALRDAAARNGDAYPFQMLHGEPASLVRTRLLAPESDLLVVGARRGGPGGPPSSTGVGRTLLYTAPCAVLTVPL